MHVGYAHVRQLQGPAPMPEPRPLNRYDTASTSLSSYIEEIKRSAIQRALHGNRDNKAKTASAPGITFRALRYKLKTLRID